MIFHPRQKKIYGNVPVVMKNTLINQVVVQTKFFGIIIDVLDPNK